MKILIILALSAVSSFAKPVLTAPSAGTPTWTYVGSAQVVGPNNIWQITTR